MDATSDLEKKMPSLETLERLTRYYQDRFKEVEFIGSRSSFNEEQNEWEDVGCCPFCLITRSESEHKDSCAVFSKDGNVKGAFELLGAWDRTILVRELPYTFSIRITNRLRELGIRTYGELISRKRDDLLGVGLLGVKSLKILEDHLSSFGLHFRS